MKKKKNMVRKKSKKTVPKTTRKKRKKSGQRGAGILKEADSLLKSLIDKEKEIIKTEDALVESMRRFRDLFEQSPIGVGIHDTEGEILIVNKSYLEIFGLDSFSKITQQNLFSDFKMTPGDAKKIQAGQIVQYENEYNFDKIDFSTSVKGTRYILFTISPLFRENEIIGYMVHVQDNTERRKVAESQRLAQLGRLLSDMAHEVNNPLMIISGRAELALLEGVGDEKVRDILNIVLEQCFFAKNIIQRLLKYSRIGKVEKRPVDIGKALDLIIEILQHHFKMSNITLKKNVIPGLPPAMVNEKQIQEVFMNILRNSADAMPDGGVITIGVSQEKDFVKTDIEDTGEGMIPEVLERIFEPFFTTKQKGTGLGLAVCHTIIQEHGGYLRYKSKIGEGTTATILLPVGNPSGSY